MVSAVTGAELAAYTSRNPQANGGIWAFRSYHRLFGAQLGTYKLTSDLEGEYHNYFHNYSSSGTTC